MRTSKLVTPPLDALFGRRAVSKEAVMPRARRWSFLHFQRIKSIINYSFRQTMSRLSLFTYLTFLYLLLLLSIFGKLIII